MTGRINHRGWVVVRSIPSPDGQYCVDLFQEPQRGFGFAHFRSDPEDRGGWTEIGDHRGLGFDDLDSALEAACARVRWVTDEMR